MLHLAFASAAHNLKRELELLDTRNLSRNIRERYFSYRSKEVVDYVSRNHRLLYGMLNADAMLMNAVLKLAVTDIPKVGLQEATANLRSVFAVQLKRFSEEFDLSGRMDELLQIATAELSRVLSNSQMST
jgi:hypothetical protein